MGVIRTIRRTLHIDVVRISDLCWRNSYASLLVFHTPTHTSTRLRTLLQFVIAVRIAWRLTNIFHARLSEDVNHIKTDVAWPVCIWSKLFKNWITSSLRGIPTIVSMNTRIQGFKRIVFWNLITWKYLTVKFQWKDVFFVLGLKGKYQRCQNSLHYLGSIFTIRKKDTTSAGQHKNRGKKFCLYFLKSINYLLAGGRVGTGSTGNQNQENCYKYDIFSIFDQVQRRLVYEYSWFPLSSFLLRFL